MHFLKLRQSPTETLDLSIRVGYLARKPWGSPLIPQHCDYKHPPPSLAFYMGAKDRTCTWVVSTFQLRYLPSWLRTVMFKMVHPLPLVLISNVPRWNVYLICPRFLRVPSPVWNAPLSKHVLQPDIRVRLPRTGNLALWFLGSLPWETYLIFVSQVCSIITKCEWNQCLPCWIVKIKWDNGTRVKSVNESSRKEALCKG